MYREAASILLFRPAEGGGEPYRLLLLHKPRKNDAWQLPQGGVEAGENVTEAALRELKEEAGIDACTVIGTSRRVYEYDFPPSFRRFRPDNVCGQRIRFIFAVAEPSVPVRVDGVEINDFMWADPSGIGRYLRRRAYADLVAALVEEGLSLVRSVSSRP